MKFQGPAMDYLLCRVNSPLSTLPMLELREKFYIWEFGLNVHPALALTLIILPSLTAKAKEEWELGEGNSQVGRHLVLDFLSELCYFNSS